MSFGSEDLALNELPEEQHECIGEEYVLELGMLVQEECESLSVAVEPFIVLDGLEESVEPSEREDISLVDHRMEGFL